MNRLAQFVFSRTACDASFVAVAAATLIFAFRSDPALALHLGGQATFLFCVALMHRVVQLERRGVTSTDAWELLDPHERPRDVQSLTGAQERVETTLLRFAKGAAGAAGALFAASLLISLL